MATNWVIIDDNAERIPHFKTAIQVTDKSSIISVFWMAANDYRDKIVPDATRCSEFPTIPEDTDIVLLDLKWGESGLNKEFDFTRDGQAIKAWAENKPSSLIYIYSTGDNAADKAKNGNLGRNVVGTHLTNPNEIAKDALSRLHNLRGVDCTAVDDFFKEISNGHDPGLNWEDAPAHLCDVAALLNESVPTIFGLDNFWKRYFGCDTYPCKRSDGDPGEFNPIYEGIKELRIAKPSLSIVSAALLLWAGMRRRCLRDNNAQIEEVDSVFFSILEAIRKSEFYLQKSGRNDYVAGPFDDRSSMLRICRAIFRFGHYFALSKDNRANKFRTLITTTSIEFHLSLNFQELQGQMPVVVDPLIETLENNEDGSKIPTDKKLALREILAMNALFGLNPGSSKETRRFCHYFRWENDSVYVFGFTRFPHLLNNSKRKKK